MPSIKLQGVSNFICRHIDLKIENGEFMVLLGPTGAGKTTLLNIIAGLVNYEGSVLFNGFGVDKISPHQRGVGYVFQNLAIFPHLNVSDNIAFGLRAQAKSSPEIQRRLDEMLHLVKIEHLARRYPYNLSGGERQRVALARALAPGPQVFLLDEPLSSLDYSTSRYLRTEIRRLQRALKITTIYVTHNQREAIEIGDRIAVMHDGVLEQVGTPKDIFFSPRNEQILKFIGSPNILRCEHCRKLAKGLAEIKSGELTIVVPDGGGEIKKIAILPSDIYISTNKPLGPDINRFTGTIVEIIPSCVSNNSAWVRLQMRDRILVTEQPGDKVKELNLQVGSRVHVILKMRYIKTLSVRGTFPELMVAIAG